MTNGGSYAHTAGSQVYYGVQSPHEVSLYSADATFGTETSPVLDSQGRLWHSFCPVDPQELADGLHPHSVAAPLPSQWYSQGSQN